MTRKSNRAKARRTRATRTLAEILEEEAHQQRQQRPPPPAQPHRMQPQPRRVQPQQNWVQHQHQHQRQPQRQQQHPQHQPPPPPPPQAQQQQQQHYVQLQELQDEIQQQQENLIHEHEVEMQEIERYFHVRLPMGTESLRTVEEVRQYSHRRHARDGEVIRRCQVFLQQLIDLKALLRQLELDREERVQLRERRHLVQSQLHTLLDSILRLNQLFYLKLEEYLDRVMYQVLQYASAMDQENEEMRLWLHSIRSDPDVMNSMARYNIKQCEQIHYRTSPGRVRPLTLISNTDWCDDVTSKVSQLVVDFGNEEVVRIDDNNVCCIICLVEYQVGDDIYRNATKDVLSDTGVTCNHFFHKGCISQWLCTTSSDYHRRTSCPCCRNHFSIHEVS